MTKEEVLEFDAYCREHGLSKHEGFKKRGITYYRYYKSRNEHKLNSEVLSTNSTPTVPTATGSFIPLCLPSDAKQEKKTRGDRRLEQNLAHGNSLTIEVRTTAGAELRIQGQINTSMLREIIMSSGKGIDNA